MASKKKRIDPSDYHQREKICRGCYYWRRISSYGDVKKICHFAHDGKGTAVLDNGKGEKMDLETGICPNKKKETRKNSFPFTVKGG